MEKLIQIKEKLANSQKIKVILINVVFLICMLLLFVPTEKMDDYRMKFTLVGAATGETSCHLLYSNIILGLLLEGLTFLFPSIAWYEVTQYILLFVSFCVVVYLIKKKNLGILGNGIIAVVLFVFGYEAYIKLTFSKTAGISAATGMILLLDALYEKKVLQKRNIGKIVLAFVLVISGALFRYKVFMMMFGISMYIVAFRTCCTLLEIPKGQRRAYIKKHIRCYCCRVGFLLMIFCVAYGLKTAGRIAFRQNEGWENYQEYNKLKAELQDFGWPSYSENYEAYEELGISKTDYTMWLNRNYSDPEKYNVELLEKVVALKESEEENVILNFFKKYPKLFLKEMTFWPVLILLVWYCMSKAKYAKLFLASSTLMVMVVNFYFYYIGRYQQHHLDMVIWFLMALIFISCWEKGNEQNIKKSVIPITILFIVWFVNDNYSYMGANSYYGTNRSVTIEESQEFLELAGEDNEHLYVTNNKENWYAYMGYSIFEQIPQGLYSNIYCLADYMYPSHKIALDNFGVYNVYREMVDNEQIYYFQSEDNSTSQLTLLLQYIQENYNPNAYAACIKKINGISVYRVFANGVSLDTSNVNKNLSGIVENIEVRLENKNVIFVEGNIYKEGCNSYDQKVYLEMIDSQTGVCIYQVVTQYEDYVQDDILNGKYGKVYDKYGVIPEDWSELDTYNIIFECEDGMYRIPVDMVVK